MACFDGHYPIALPAGGSIGKHLLEDLDTLEQGEAQSVLPVGAGAEDALRRP
jgi:amidophosphoribosyltransferase